VTGNPPDSNISIKEKRDKWVDTHICSTFKKQYFWMLDKIENKDNLSHIRLGDGECVCALSEHRDLGGTQNYDGDTYGLKGLSTEMINALVNPILSDSFIYGLASHTGSWTPEMKEYGIWSDKIVFRQAELFIWASVVGEIDILFNMVNQRNSVLVAPKYLHNTNIKFNTYIETPPQNTWDTNGAQLVEEIYQISLKQPKDTIFCFCTGMSAIPLIYHLHKKIAERHTLLDIGSVIDPYVEKGRYRSWMELIPTSTIEKWKAK